MLTKRQSVALRFNGFFRRHSRVLGIALMVMLASAVLAVAGSSFRIVSINNGGSVSKMYTLKSDVEGILGFAGYGDEYDVTATVKKGNRIYIEVEPTFNVYVTVGEETVSVITHRCTVDEAIAMAGIIISENDLVNPSSDTVLTEESYIDIIPYTEPEPVVVSTETVSPAVSTAAAVNLSTGNTISTLVPDMPIPLDENGIPLNYTKATCVQATAYTYTGHRCSTGVSPQPGYIAVNPNIIPYGTKMYIVSADGRFNYGYAIAADTGGFIKSRPTNVDLFFASNAACKSFGRRDVMIYFIAE